MRLKYILEAISTSLLLLITGCNTDPRKGKAKDVDPITSEATENKELHFFATNKDFVLSNKELAEAERILKTAISMGETNVSFMFVSNTVVPEEVKEAARKKIRALMYKVGFLDSRIVDAGTVVYNDARVGIRIDVLKYNVKNVNTKLWDTSLGDANIYKNIPRFGSSNAYNLNEMIENKADLVHARKYKGQRVVDAIGALGSGGSSSGGLPGKSSGSSNSGSSSGSSSSSSSSGK